MNIHNRAQAIVLKEIASLGGVETAAAGSAWWDGLSRQEKRAYIVKHPKSKYGQSAGGQRVVQRHHDRSTKAVERHEKGIATNQARISRLTERHTHLQDRLKEARRAGKPVTHIHVRINKLNDRLEGRKQKLAAHKAGHKLHTNRVAKLTEGLQAITGKSPAKKAAAPAKAPAKKAAAPAKPAAKAPAKAPAKKAAPAKVPAKAPAQKGQLHDHLGVPHGTKLPTAKLLKLAKSDHELAPRAKMALHFRGVKVGQPAKKPANKPAAAPTKAPAAKPAQKTKAQRKADQDFLSGKTNDPRPTRGVPAPKKAVAPTKPAVKAPAKVAPVKQAIKQIVDAAKTAPKKDAAKAPGSTSRMKQAAW